MKKLTYLLLILNATILPVYDNPINWNLVANEYYAIHSPYPYEQLLVPDIQGTLPTDADHTALHLACTSEDTPDFSHIQYTLDTLRWLHCQEKITTEQYITTLTTANPRGYTPLHDAVRDPAYLANILRDFNTLITDEKSLNDAQRTTLIATLAAENDVNQTPLQFVTLWGLTERLKTIKFYLLKWAQSGALTQDLATIICTKALRPDKPAPAVYEAQEIIDSLKNLLGDQP